MQLNDPGDTFESESSPTASITKGGLSMGPVIGQGSFGVVHVAKYYSKLVAVKKILIKGKDEHADEHFNRELNVLKAAKHPNLLKYIGTYGEMEWDKHDETQCSKLYIVTELCPGGNFLDLLINHKIELSWPLRLRIARQAADAIEFLHTNNLIHRDIKSSNLLLDDSWTCKVADFGM